MLESFEMPNVRSSSNDAGIGRDTTRLMLLADLSLWTANQQILRRDVDTGGTVAFATDTDRFQTGRRDDTALLPHRTAFD